MARLVTCGFETALIGGTSTVTHPESQNAATIGAPTIDTTTKRTGVAAATATTVGNYSQFQGVVSVLDRTYYARAYLRFADATPAATLVPMSITGNGITILSVRLRTDGRLVLLDANGVEIGSTSAILSDATWYRVELEIVVPTAGNGTASLRLDGTEVHRTTSIDVNNSITNGHLRVGPNAGTTGPQVWWDDVALNDNQGASQNGFPGAGSIYMLVPDQDGALGTGWMQPQTVGADTTDIWQSVDNRPPTGVAFSDVDANNLKYIFNATNLGAASHYEANIQTYDAVVPSGEVIKLVQALVRVATDSLTGTNTGTIQLLSNPADAGTTAIDFEGSAAVAGTEPAGWRTYRNTVAYSPTVTRSTRPVLRVSRTQLAITRAHLVDLMGVYVEMAPSTGQTIAVGEVTETGTAQPIGEAKAKAVGLVSETDTALPMTHSKVKAVGLAAETQTAQPIGRAKAKAVGLASETETAQPIAHAKSRAVGQAQTTEIALPITASKVKVVNQAQETDTAHSIIRAVAAGSTPKMPILHAGD